jgi:DNA-binding MarR family transcriptional regulator
VRLAGRRESRRYCAFVATTTSGARSGASQQTARAVEQASLAFVEITVAAVAADGGISLQQLRALLALERSGPVNLSAFAAGIDASLPSASRLVGRLEEAGLVQRATSARSRREVEVRLTSAGRSALTTLRTARRREIAKVLRRLDGTRADELAAALDSFATAYTQSA